ncbi:hypothetical protein CPB84DRAFT_439476 [Gymnopilus junonius]|uniref:10TM putative phosphate transporter extracellular tail domain-containing protein n=1 Tax=Gymnopilus junonius TaxID=109634 RepID=A0A9P5N934_GYMJU|nr:hypothetical protein CPB84DRAFT_439476 [Gymnopilus junonius]
MANWLLERLRTKVRRDRSADNARLENLDLDEEIIESTIPVTPSSDGPAVGQVEEKNSNYLRRSNAPSKRLLASGATALTLDEFDLSGEDGDVHEFDHPSIYVDQSWIWIPKDTLGLSGYLKAELKDAGVDASDIGAFMDHKGVVEVTGSPADEGSLDEVTAETETENCRQIQDQRFM